MDSKLLYTNVIGDEYMYMYCSYSWSQTRLDETYL